MNGANQSGLSSETDLLSLHRCLFSKLVGIALSTLAFTTGLWFERVQATPHHSGPYDPIPSLIAMVSPYEISSPLSEYIVFALKEDFIPNRMNSQISEKTSARPGERGWLIRTIYGYKLKRKHQAHEGSGEIEFHPVPLGSFRVSAIRAGTTENPDRLTVLSTKMHGSLSHLKLKSERNNHAYMSVHVSLDFHHPAQIYKAGSHDASLGRPRLYLSSLADLTPLSQNGKPAPIGPHKISQIESEDLRNRLALSYRLAKAITPENTHETLLTTVSFGGRSDQLGHLGNPRSRRKAENPIRASVQYHSRDLSSLRWTALGPSISGSFRWDPRAKSLILVRHDEPNSTTFTELGSSLKPNTPLIASEFTLRPGESTNSSQQLVLLMGSEDPLPIETDEVRKSVSLNECSHSFD